jgi:alkanesulfonate monooxygenase SsuD/methylene tetrahydromethanopterin reductase-like flavin-dependent oxidoreductase (luciferase family)
MEVVLFHLMPYADLDLEAGREHGTVWVNLPNSNFDPVKGHRLYNRYLDELEHGEELGFDAIAVNEHHQTAYGLMPSPIVTASALARRTSRAKIAILGSALPLREHPLMVAEEHAMIDVISGGRLISGFVRGIGAEYHTFGVNPTFSHDRFHEAHDLIVRAWTEPGPFAFQGRHYNVQYVNLWPRPYQKPHPPIWIPSQGSKETIDWAAHPDRRYTYLQTFSPANVVQRYLKMYRDTCEGFGYEAEDRQLGWAVPVYVAATDEAARAEAKPHFEAFRNVFLKMPVEMLLPPGYTSRESLKNVMKAKAAMFGDITLEKSIELGLVVCGSPNTVREVLGSYWKDMRFGNLLVLCQFGTLPADLTRRNMELFAREVMPAVKALESPAGATVG